MSRTACSPHPCGCAFLLFSAFPFKFLPRASPASAAYFRPHKRRKAENSCVVTLLGASPRRQALRHSHQQPVLAQALL